MRRQLLVRPFGCLTSAQWAARVNAPCDCASMQQVASRWTGVQSVYNPATGPTEMYVAAGGIVQSSCAAGALRDPSLTLQLQQGVAWP
jgi:hypothetical protein